jgi:hypothetical protein
VKLSKNLKTSVVVVVTFFCFTAKFIFWNALLFLVLLATGVAGDTIQLGNYLSTPSGLGAIANSHTLYVPFSFSISCSFTSLLLTTNCL